MVKGANDQEKEDAINDVKLSTFVEVFCEDLEIKDVSNVEVQ